MSVGVRNLCGAAETWRATLGQGSSGSSRDYGLTLRRERRKRWRGGERKHLWRGILWLRTNEDECADFLVKQEAEWTEGVCLCRIISVSSSCGLQISMTMSIQSDSVPLEHFLLLSNYKLPQSSQKAWSLPPTYTDTQG